MSGECQCYLSRLHRRVVLAELLEDFGQQVAALEQSDGAILVQRAEFREAIARGNYLRPVVFRYGCVSSLRLASL
jgi:hypothetical protein